MGQPVAQPIYPVVQQVNGSATVRNLYTIKVPNNDNNPYIERAFTLIELCHSYHCSAAIKTSALAVFLQIASCLSTSISFDH